MKLKPNYILIPIITIVVAILGSWFTKMGMTWYEKALVKPEITPPDWAFPLAWTLIFILTTIAALIVWNKGKEQNSFLWGLITRKENTRIYWLIVELFIANAVLNVLWCFLFFQIHWIQMALVEMVLLETTIILLIYLIASISKLASVLLLPYALWVGFATYLTYLIWMIN